MTYPYKSLCVFCGSADNLDQCYYDAACEMGKLFAQKNITLIFGGGRTGLMGSIAEGALQQGGEVVGVVPLGLESPQLVYTTGLSRLEIVDNIQQRKARMNELSEGFIALPGGFGTLDEIFEVLTWSQIGLHRKPSAFLNVNGYYDHLLKWFERAYTDRFIYEEHKQLFVSDITAAGVLDKLAEFAFPSNIGRWLVR